jgi:BRCT domain type II-containing protein
VLDGLTIVLSGIFLKLAREKLKDFIENHGGRCTGSVSGKTTHLVVGHKLEDGRDVIEGSKYKTAKAKGIKILFEHEFEQLIRDLSKNQNF